MQIRDQGIRYDWLGRLCICLGCDRHSYASRLRDFQGDMGLPATGFLDAPTRLTLTKTYEPLKIRTIGPFLHTRLILDTSGTEAAIFDRLTDILQRQNCLVPEERFSSGILAIRGVASRSDGWHQTGSARDFAAQPYGARNHFSSDKSDYADSLIALMARENGIKRVQLFAGVTSPCAIWPAGTAHLCPGQYLYKIGRHRTREPAHIEAAEAMFRQSLWPQSWCFERTEDSIRYAALEGTSQIEIVRSTGDSLDISAEDIARAEREIALRNPAFVDAQCIKINIHSCSMTRASSLGCQNILPEDYARFMSELMRMAALQTECYGFALDIPYALCDASEIAG
ncbi:MAG: hypothetical protein IJ165_10415 [Proteobacteria bacterium]|nr:hypothetical protein [Pseudomonadota bacterium]